MLATTRSNCLGLLPSCIMQHEAVRRKELQVGYNRGPRAAPEQHNPSDKSAFCITLDRTQSPNSLRVNDAAQRGMAPLT
jgi:hypothetical protein